VEALHLMRLRRRGPEQDHLVPRPAFGDTGARRQIVDDRLLTLPTAGEQQSRTENEARRQFGRTRTDARDPLRRG
jgi:hypothetical protein